MARRDNPYNLTPLQWRFVQEYLVDLNAAEAYRRAGYKARGHAAEASASRLLSNVEVASAIQAEQVERGKRTAVTAERVVHELGKLGFADIRAYFDDNGHLRPLHELGDAAAGAVASVESFEQYASGGPGANQVPIGMLRKLKLWDKNAALVTLAKHLGMLIEKRELTGKDGAALPPLQILLTQEQA